MNKDTYGDFSFIYNEDKDVSFSIFPVNIEIVKVYSEYKRNRKKKKWYSFLRFWSK